MAYQIEGDDESTRTQEKFLPLCQTSDLGLESKDQIPLKGDLQWHAIACAFLFFFQGMQ